MNTTINVLFISALSGAFISSVLINNRSPILSDRLIVAAIGAVIGLLIAAAILLGWQLNSVAWAMVEDAA